MNKIQISLIKQADARREKLNEWECGFIDNMLSRDEDFELSEKQNHALNIISQKVI